jgi:hypothetical protein
MSATTGAETAPTTTTRPRVPATVRGAQLLLLIPLGAFPLGATIAFSLVLGLHGKDYLPAIWAQIMSIACLVTAVRLSTGQPRQLRIALGLLAAQTAFSLLKLLVFGESAALVFLALAAACAGLLALPVSRRHFGTPSN